MLSAKPWKLEAILRLFVSLFVCVYAGSLLSGLPWRFTAPRETADVRFEAAKTHFRDCNARARNNGIITSRQFVANQAYVDDLRLSLEQRPTKLIFSLAGVSSACLVVTLFLVRKPWQAEGLPRRLTALLLFFYGGLCLGAGALDLAGPGGSETSVARMLIGTLSFQGAALVLIARFVREHHTTWTEAFGFSNHWPQVLLIGVTLACLFLPLGQGLQQISIILMERLPHLHIQPEEQQAVQTLRIAESWVDRISLGAVTILLAPAAEETLFRGILYPWIKKAGFPRLALWLTSLLFAAIHINVATFLPLFVLALALALMYEKTNNLLGCITAHAVFNALNFVKLYLFQKGAGSP